MLAILAIPVVAKSIFYLFHAPTRGMDGVRFMLQAESLFAGRGYPPFDQLMSPIYVSVPPGYPVFITLLFYIWHSEPLVLFVQYLLSIASCYFVYFALKPRVPRLALVALVVMSISPMMGRLMASVLSETLSIFLSSLLVYLFSLSGKGRTYRAAAIGLLLCCLALTSPVAVPLTLALLAAYVWNHRRQWKTVSAVLVAWAIPMTVWQIDCVKRSGRIQPTVFYELPNAKNVSGIRLWHRTWSTGEGDLSALWSIGNSPLSKDAFRSGEEKSRLTQMETQYWAGKLDPLKYDDAFRQIAKERIAQNPARFYFWLPLWRAADLWLGSMPAFGPWDRSKLAVPENWSASAVVGFVGAHLNYVFYALQPLLFLWLLFASLKSRDPVPCAFAAGVLFYTALCGWTAQGEERRNYPFYPFLFFSAYYAYAPRLVKGRAQLFRHDFKQAPAI